MDKEPRSLSCLAVAFGLVFTGLIGCQQEEPKSPDDVDGHQGTFAAGYTARITTLSKNARAHEAKAKDDIATMPNFPGQLDDNAPPDKVVAILDAADAAGRDEGYGAEAKKSAMLQQFFDEEKDPFTKKVGGSAQWAAKQKGCDVDLYGPVAQGIKDGFDDRIKDRMHKNNDAFLLIDHDRDALGKKNVTALEDEADKIAEASYIVHVELPDKKKRLDYAVEQLPKQKDALNKLISDEKDRQSKEKLKPEDQKLSDAHLKEWNDALSGMDAAGNEAKQNAADLDDRVKTIGNDYDTKFSAMKDAVKAKAPKK